MRIATIIIGTLMLLLTIGVGFLGTYRSLRDAKDIDKIVKPVKKLKGLAGAKTADKLTEMSKLPGKLRAGAVFFAITAVLGLALMIMMYINKGVMYGAIGLTVLAIVSIIVNPHYDLGPNAPVSARTLAWAVGIMAVLGAAAAYGASALKARKLKAAAATASPAVA